MAGRRKLKDVRPGALGYLDNPPSEPGQRDRSWERRQREGDLCTVTYRRMPVELRAAIRDIADHLGVVADDVARAFLEAGLELYNGGELGLDPAPIAGRRKGAWTLYPETRGPAE